MITDQKKVLCGLLYIRKTKRRLDDQSVEHVHSICSNQHHLLVASHFNSSSHSLSDMSILGLLHCHNEATRTKKIFYIRQMFTCTFANVVYCVCCFRYGLLYI
eukprot:g37840.t1